MVGAQAAIVWASPLYRGIVGIGHLRRLDKDLTAAAVVVHVIGQQYLFTAVLGAALQHEDLVVLEDDLSFHLAQALGADRDGNIVKKIRTNAISQWSSS